MTAEVAHVVAEVTRQVANLMQQGHFQLSVGKLAECLRKDRAIFDAVVTNLKDYVLPGDLDDLAATAEMVI